jgi:16S rRNA (guanine(527)-N(7))-methyltransferase RsmG
LKELGPDEFRRQLAALAPQLPPGALSALSLHYQELLRWNRLVSLVGPGTGDEIVARHYGEALAALPLLPPPPPAGTLALLDIGSGAGFPGMVLAAVRPDLVVTLVEPREKKWSFLLAASRRASLPCRCLNVRVALPLPAGIPERLDVVTVRALRLEVPVLAALADRLSPAGRIVLWVGAEDPALPATLQRAAELPLAGSDCRRVLALQRALSLE